MSTDEAISIDSIEVRGMRFDALTAGPADGEVALLLHGFPQGARMWRPVLAPLAAAGYRAVAFDQRGYSPGARPTDDAAYAMDELVADVVAVADHLGADSFHVVGHDWGGAVAWRTAEAQPERVATLTSLSTPHPSAIRAAIHGEVGGDQAERSGYMAFFAAPGAAELMVADEVAGLRTLFEASDLPAAEAQPYVEALGSVEALDAALAWYRAAKGGLTGPATDTTVPTLYIWGVDDPALGREAAEATAGYVAGPYRFVELEGVGHWVVESAPEKVASLLLEHLATALT